MNEHWVLVAEDDIEMRDRILVAGLRDLGFRNVVGVGSAIEVYRSMLATKFAMFVLDVELPDESGLTVARHVRAVSDAGIVMLSGRWRSRAHQAKGLDEGADAYLTKPVDIELLAATLRSVLRRREAPIVPSAASNDDGTGWKLDSSGWNLTSPGGVTIRLTQAERVLLALLFDQAGNVVTREQIILKLIEGAGVAQSIHDFDPHRMELLVHRLRRKVAAATQDLLPLRTIRGTGYVLTPQ